MCPFIQNEVNVLSGYVHCRLEIMSIKYAFYLAIPYEYGSFRLLVG